MAIKAWSDFLSDARTSLPQCPDPLIENALRTAAIEFCSRSKVLKSDLSFSTIAGQALYSLNTGTELAAVKIVAVSLDKEPINPMLGDDLTLAQKTETGVPTYYLLENDTSARLIKVPNRVYAVAMTVAVTPSLESSGLEMWVADKYRRTLISGALSLLMLMPGKPWSNDAQAVYHGAKFEEGIQVAGADRVKSGASAPLRTQRAGAF